MAKKVFQVEGRVPHSGGEGLDVEDGGQALICGELEETRTVVLDDPCFFVRLHSWSDMSPVNNPPKHPLMEQLMGRRVRVTIEILD